MLTVAVVEDDPDDAVALVRHLRRYERERRVPVTVLTHPDGSGLVEQDTAGVDLVLLDVEMPGVDGPTAAARLRERDRGVSIVLVSRGAGRAIQGYAVDAAGFLVKPVAYPAIARELDRAAARAHVRERVPLILGTGPRAMTVDPADVVLIEGERRRVAVHTLDGVYRMTATLKSIEAALAGRGFHRVHHGYIVNLAHVTSARGDECELVTHHRVPVSRPRRTAFLAALTDHLSTSRA